MKKKKLKKLTKQLKYELTLQIQGTVRAFEQHQQEGFNRIAKEATENFAQLSNSNKEFQIKQNKFVPEEVSRQLASIREEVASNNILGRLKQLEQKLEDYINVKPVEVE